MNVMCTKYTCTQIHRDVKKKNAINATTELRNRAFQRQENAVLKLNALPELYPPVFILRYGICYRNEQKKYW